MMPVATAIMTKKMMRSGMGMFHQPQRQGMPGGGAAFHVAQLLCVSDDERRWTKDQTTDDSTALRLLCEPIKARSPCTDELDEAARLEVSDVAPGCSPRNLPLFRQISPARLPPGDNLGDEPLLASIYSLIYA